MNGVPPLSAPFPTCFLEAAAEALSAPGTPSAIHVAWRMWALHTEKEEKRRNERDRRQNPIRVTSESYERKT